MTFDKILSPLMLGVCLFAAQPAVAGTEVKFDFATEKVGAEPTSFVPMVGNWVVGKEGDNVLLMVEGSLWSRNQPSAGIADKARALYGERYAEFLDNVKSYAYYPLAVAKEVEDFRQGAISFRFKGISGRIDQGRESSSTSSPAATTWYCAPTAWRITSCCSSTNGATEAQSNGFATRRHRQSNGMN
jgi:hypothetical protein